MNHRQVLLNPVILYLISVLHERALLITLARATWLRTLRVPIGLQSLSMINATRKILYQDLIIGFIFPDYVNNARPYNLHTNNPTNINRVLTIVVITLLLVSLVFS